MATPQAKKSIPQGSSPGKKTPPPKAVPGAFPKIRVTVMDTCGQQCIHRVGDTFEFTNPYSHPLKMCEVMAAILEPYILAHSLGEVDWKPEAPNPPLGEKDKEKGLVYCPSKGGVVLKIEKIE